MSRVTIMERKLLKRSCLPWCNRTLADVLIRQNEGRDARMAVEGFEGPKTATFHFGPEANLPVRSALEQVETCDDGLKPFRTDLSPCKNVYKAQDVHQLENATTRVNQKRLHYLG